MKSNLNKTEFEKRLTELVSEEKGFFFITSYNSSGTPFCGTHDDKSFELTRNSFWRHAKAITIRGEYKASDNNTTEVTYELGLSKFTKFFFIAVNSAVFILFNTLVILTSNNFDSGILLMLLIFHGFLVFANLWGFTVNWVTKKLVDRRFKEAFEIGIEDEWEKLARSAAEGNYIRE
jgi:hypothetical protein